MQPIETLRDTNPRRRPTRELDAVVVRFAGDSGDGMQLTGNELTKASAIAGNELSTFPDYPAEIRAPAGTVAGVSGFQIQFSSHRVYTPGDAADVLVVMNPAALKANLADVKRGGTIVVNESAFTPHNLARAGYAASPLEDGGLAGYRVHVIPISRLVELTLQGSGLGVKEIGRASNMWALGLVFWMFSRPVEPEIEAIRRKFAARPDLCEANVRVFRAGLAYGESAEIFDTAYAVPPARIRAGTYRNVTGNVATALGFVTAAELAGLRLFLGSYPITPASEILHELASYRHHGVISFQAEDEIAGIAAAIGAAYSGMLGLTTTSGPGMALKAEALGLAIMLELPLVVVDVQRGGPSTGLPTKTEQSDLLQAVFGRHGEAPLPVLAARSPADCFETAVEAARVAIAHMTPVVMLTDGFVANGSEPWRLPEREALPRFAARFRTEPKDFAAYARDPETLARDWVVPGTPGLEHRVGGLEKDALTGEISYAPGNHEAMVRTRAEKVARVAREIPPTAVRGPMGGVLLLSWGGTFGAVASAQEALAGEGYRVAHAHLRWLNPLPADLGALMKRFARVVVPELNLGQLCRLVRAEHLVDAIALGKVQGQPFKVSELIERVRPIAAGL